MRPSPARTPQRAAAGTRRDAMGNVVGDTPDWPPQRRPSASGGMVDISLQSDYGGDDVGAFSSDDDRMDGSGARGKGDFGGGRNGRLVAQGDVEVGDDSEDGGSGLRKSLGPLSLIAMGVGAIIGAGIFVLTGTAAVGHSNSPGAGPALFLSFLLTGSICTCAALCYAEFAAIVPVSGSAYAYSLYTMGDRVAWVVGWALVLEYPVGATAVAVGWSGTLVSMIRSLTGWTLPWITSNTLDTISDAALAADPSVLLSVPFRIPFGEPQNLVLRAAINAPAIVLVLVLSVFLLVGIQESARLTSMLVYVKVVIVMLFVVVGGLTVAMHPSTSYDHWFADGLHTFMPNGVHGILAGAAATFFAYIGFDAVSTVAEETRNPARNVPIGIIASVSICTVLYVMVSSVLTLLVPIDQIDVNAPISSAMEYVNIPLAKMVVDFGALAGLGSVVMVLMTGGIRIIYAMSRDGLLPPQLSAVHPRFQTPHYSTALVAVFCLLGAGFLPISVLAEVVNIGTLLAFCIVSFGVILLRIRQPDRYRPFRVPLGYTLPVTSLVGCITVMLFLPALTWLIGVLWFAFGVLIYVVYGRRHSRVRGLGFDELALRHETAQAAPFESRAVAAGGEPDVPPALPYDGGAGGAVGLSGGGGDGDGGVVFGSDGPFASRLLLESDYGDSDGMHDDSARGDGLQDERSSSGEGDYSLSDGDSDGVRPRAEEAPPRRALSLQRLVPQNRSTPVVMESLDGSAEEEVAVVPTSPPLPPSTVAVPSVFLGEDDDDSDTDLVDIHY